MNYEPKGRQIIETNKTGYVKDKQNLENNPHPNNKTKQEIGYFIAFLNMEGYSVTSVKQHKLHNE